MSEFTDSIKAFIDQDQDSEAIYRVAQALRRKVRDPNGGYVVYCAIELVISEIHDAADFSVWLNTHEG